MPSHAAYNAESHNPTDSGWCNQCREGECPSEVDGTPPAVYKCSRCGSRVNWLHIHKHWSGAALCDHCKKVTGWGNQPSEVEGSNGRPPIEDDKYKCKCGNRILRPWDVGCGKCKRGNPIFWGAKMKNPPPHAIAHMERYTWDNRPEALPVPTTTIPTSEYERLRRVESAAKEFLAADEAEWQKWQSDRYTDCGVTDDCEHSQECNDTGDCPYLLPKTEAGIALKQALEGKEA